MTWRCINYYVHDVALVTYPADVTFEIEIEIGLFLLSYLRFLERIAAERYRKLISSPKYFARSECRKDYYVTGKILEIL